jgi:type IV secretory pathway VirB9-like protein
VFKYAAGTRYLITSAVLHVTDIVLQPGEEIRGQIASGDSVRWVVGVDTRDHEQHHVFIKPTKPGLSTNIIVRTNRRTYLLDLRSAAADAPFMVTVGWTYPDGTRVQTAPNAGTNHS